MFEFLILFLHVLVAPFKTQARLEAEIVVLRHRLNVLSRRVPLEAEVGGSRPTAFRLALSPVTIIQLETVIRWHRAGFRLCWRWKSRSRGGRPKVPMEIRRLIREMSLANQLWGAPRIHGELLKLGIDVAQSTLAKIHGEEWPRTIADLENLSAQSCVRHRRVRRHQCGPPTLTPTPVRRRLSLPAAR